MDEVFRAIGDPNRRMLLDALFREDGQTLTALCAHLPEMTRQGVMSHLTVLEEAGLVTTRRAGRAKHHYLNPVPIRLIHDRWIDKYAEPRAAAMAAIKRYSEGAEMDKPSHVYTAHIAAPADRVWNALTDGDMTVQYYYGTRVSSSWEQGAGVSYAFPDGTVAADGEILAIDPGKRIEMTFHARWDPELEAEGPVREVWAIEEANGITTLTHELWDVDPDTKTFAEFTGGDSYIISGLKTLVETGSPMGTS